MEKPKVIVICGPTASGKTALSIELAKKINGEIISADSMQIYKDMDIGTAKPTVEEMQNIKHYLIDCVSPSVRYSVADFKKDATFAIEEILKDDTKKLTLKSLFIIPGEHVIDDILNSNDSWSEKIKSKGIEITIGKKSLLQYEKIRNSSAMTRL